MFRRPQAETFINYQLQASLGRQPSSGKIAIKRRKRTKIKKRKDSFILRSQDIDKRRTTYRPDRLLALHQSSLNNATRDATEVQRGLTAIGTTIQSERDTKEKKALEQAKGRVLTALASKLESNEPLFGNYPAHRQPDVIPLGYREPRPEPEPQLELTSGARQTSYASHRQPQDLNRQVEPLLVDDPVAEDVEDITDQTPIPRTEKPKVGKLDPSKLSALQGLEFQVASADDPRVKQAENNAQQQRNVQRQQAQQNEPQLREPQPEPEEEPEEELERTESQKKRAKAFAKVDDDDTPVLLTQQPKTISVDKSTEVPPTEFQPLSEGTEVRNLDAECIKQGLAVAKAKEKRKVKMAERFSQLSGAIEEDRLAEFDEFEPTPEPEPIPEPQPEPEVKAKGKVEDLDEFDEGEENWKKAQEIFGQGKRQNKLGTAKNKYKLRQGEDHFKITDFDGKLGGGRFAGEQLVISDINTRTGNVLVQRSSITNTGQKPTPQDQANIKFSKLQQLIQSGDIPIEKIDHTYIHAD